MRTIAVFTMYLCTCGIDNIASDSLWLTHVFPISGCFSKLTAANVFNLASYSFISVSSSAINVSINTNDGEEYNVMKNKTELAISNLFRGETINYIIHTSLIVHNANYYDKYYVYL